MKQAIKSMNIGTRSVRAIALAGAAVLALASQAKAITYSFATDSPNAQAGSTFNIYLQETLGSGETSFIAAQNGLFGAGFAVSYAGGVGPLDLIAVSANSAAFNGLFNSEVRSTTQVASLMSVDLLATSGVLPDANGRILLGTATISSTLTGVPVAFRIGNYFDAAGNTVTFTDNYDLEYANLNPLGTTISPTFVTVFSTIPEPSAMSLLTVPALGLRRRR